MKRSQDLSCSGRGMPVRAEGEFDPAAAHRLLHALRAHGYEFITPTPGTHQRVLRKAEPRQAESIRDVLGWSMPFSPETIPQVIEAALQRAGFIECAPGGLLRATVRVSSLGGDLFLHSAFPTSARDAVFFGPDTYRFARFLEYELAEVSSVQRLIDIGTGSGAGAVAVARAVPTQQIVACDVNPTALRMASVNLEVAGVEASFVESEGLEKVEGSADLIIANPPFIAGGGGQTYRDGGEMHGARLSLDWALEATRRLSPGGRLLLYTGVAIIEGVDPLRTALRAGLREEEFHLQYAEIDTDIFGELLDTQAYADAERIAAVGAVVQRR